MKDPADGDLKKKKVARLSIISNASLVLMKLFAGLAVGSISIISEAVHSSVDLLASFIAYFSVKKSSIPPDGCHEYGHGKFEDVSGIVEAILIVAAAAIILYESISALIRGENLYSTEFLDIGIAVMFISALMNLFVSSRLFSVAHETGSIALESDGWHLRTDVFTSVGVMIGLILIRITGITQLDSLIAIAIAFVILHAAYGLIKKAFGHLTDRTLPPGETEEILKVIERFCDDDVRFHAFKCRRAGPDIFVEFHLTVPGRLSVDESHDLTKRIEAALQSRFCRIFVTIHVEPAAA